METSETSKTRNSRPVTAVDILAGEGQFLDGYYVHPCRRPSYWAAQCHPAPYLAVGQIDAAVAREATLRGWPRVQIWCCLQSSVGLAMGDQVPGYQSDEQWHRDLRDWAAVWLDVYAARMGG